MTADVLGFLAAMAVIGLIGFIPVALFGAWLIEYKGKSLGQAIVGSVVLLAIVTFLVYLI